MRIRRKILKEGWVFHSRERERHGKKRETGRDQLWGRLLDSWVQPGDIPFLQPHAELSSFPGSRDYLGTDAEKVTFRHCLSHKLRDNFHTPDQCHGRPVVCKFVIRIGAQGNVKTIAPGLMLAPFSFE